MSQPPAVGGSDGAAGTKHFLIHFIDIRCRLGHSVGPQCLLGAPLGVIALHAAGCSGCKARSMLMHGDGHHPGHRRDRVPDLETLWLPERDAVDR